MKLIKSKWSNYHLKLFGFILLPIIVLLLFYYYHGKLDHEIHPIPFLLMFLFGFSLGLVGAKWVEIQMQIQLEGMQKEIESIRETDNLLSVRNDRLKEIAKSVNDLTSAHKMNQIILDTIPIGVIFYDKDGKVRCVNKVANQLTGYTKEEIDHFILKRSLLTDERNFWEELQVEKEIYGQEKYCPVKNGEQIPVVTSTKPIYNDSNQLVGIVSTFEDIIEQKRLSKIEEHAKIILDHISDGVITVDNEGIINGFNKGAEIMTGLDPEEVYGKKYDDLFIKTRTIFTKLTKTLNTNIEYTNLKKEMKSADGKRVFLMITTKILYNKKGEKIGAIGIYKDITPMVELEEQIQRADKLAVVGELAAGTAHEIRNPLTTIKGFIQLLGSEIQIEDKQKFIKLMLDEITHINEIIKEMILLSKPAFPHKTPVSLSQILKETIEFMQAEGNLHNIEFEFNLEELPIIDLDERQIKQVFINIIRNAIQSMNFRQSGKIHINSNQNDLTNKIEINFIDEGVGIPEEVLQRIYEPFFTTKDDGTGLGLPVSCRIMQNHGGQLTLSSEEGIGTKVTLTFPIDTDT